MGHRSKRFKLFPSANLEALVPGTSFYRMLEAKLDLTFVRTLAREHYEEMGRPSIDPIVFFKLQLVMFFEGLRSERQLVYVAADRLSVRWYLGYDIDEPLPDHSSLTRIRQRLGLPIFERFFDHITELCEQAGLIKGDELIFDGTQVRANAAMDSLEPRWAVEARAHLRDLFAEEDGKGDGSNRADFSPPTPEPEQGCVPEGTSAAPLRLPFVGSADEERQVAEENQAAWKLLEEHRRTPEQPSSSRGYARVADAYVSTTDPDATPMRTRGSGATKLGYHDH